jgi:hypothetical protein
MQLHDVTHQRESETEPPYPSRDRGVALLEAIEHELQKIRSDPAAIIDNRKYGGSTFLPHRGTYEAAGPRELDRIGEEIPRHLSEALGIGEDHASFGSRIELERDGLRKGRRPNDIEGVTHDGGQVDELRLEAEFACNHPRNIEDVVDDLHLRLSVAVNHLQRLIHGGIGSPPSQ